MCIFRRSDYYIHLYSSGYWSTDQNWTSSPKAGPCTRRDGGGQPSTKSEQCRERPHNRKMGRWGQICEIRSLLGLQYLTWKLVCEYNSRSAKATFVVSCARQPPVLLCHVRIPYDVDHNPPDYPSRTPLVSKHRRKAGARRIDESAAETRTTHAQRQHLCILQTTSITPTLTKAQSLQYRRQLVPMSAIKPATYNYNWKVMTESE